MVDKLSQKSHLTVPWFVAFKSFSDLVSNSMMFYQPSPPNFMVSLYGVFVNFFFGKGFFGVIILTLKTVVDPKAANISVSFALLFGNLNTLIVSQILGVLEKRGVAITDMLFWVSNICQLICIPCFLIVGLKIRSMMNKIDDMEEGEEKDKMMVRRQTARQTFRHVIDSGNINQEVQIDNLLRDQLIPDFYISRGAA